MSDHTQWQKFFRYMTYRVLKRRHFNDRIVHRYSIYSEIYLSVFSLQEWHIAPRWNLAWISKPQVQYAHPISLQSAQRWGIKPKNRNFCECQGKTPHMGISLRSIHKIFTNLAVFNFFLSVISWHHHNMLIFYMCQHWGFSPVSATHCTNQSEIWQLTGIVLLV